MIRMSLPQVDGRIIFAHPSLLMNRSLLEFAGGALYGVLCSGLTPFRAITHSMSSEFDHLLDKPEKPRRRWRWWQDYLDRAAAHLSCWGAVERPACSGIFLKTCRRLEPLQNYQPSLVTRVYSDDRQVIGQFFIERRFLKPLQEIPKSLTHAVIATEDARFFEHPGLDIVGIFGRPGRISAMADGESKGRAPSLSSSHAPCFSPRNGPLTGSFAN